MNWLRRVLSSRAGGGHGLTGVILTAVVIAGTHGISLNAQQRTTRPFGGTGAFPGVEEKVPSYTIPPSTYDGITPGFHRAPQDDYRLGPSQEVETYQEEHRVYKSPFRYKNAAIDYWWEYSEKGVEIQAERGSITITETKPIVSVTVVGSGCETPGYNIVEWWSEGEDKWAPRGQLMKRQRIGDLRGQHPQFLHGALMTRQKFTSLEEANKQLEMIQNAVYAKSFGFTIPGSVMGGDYENTAYFRIGDARIFAEEASQKTGDVHRMPQGNQECHRVVIRAGGMDIEEGGKGHQYFPSDYAVRLIDIVVKK